MSGLTEYVNGDIYVNIVCYLLVNEALTMYKLVVFMQS